MGSPVSVSLGVNDAVEVSVKSRSEQCVTDLWGFATAKKMWKQIKQIPSGGRVMMMLLVVRRA